MFRFIRQIIFDENEVTHSEEAFVRSIHQFFQENISYWEIGNGFMAMG